MDENARLTRVRKRRWWQLSFRSILVFTAIYAAYVAALLGFWSLLGARAIFFPTLPSEACGQATLFAIEHA